MKNRLFEKMSTNFGNSEAIFNRYRPWFYAAALYNLLWGSVNVMFPAFIFGLVRMEEPTNLPFWQVVGMFVLVYAPAYWWAARYPTQHPHLILIGMMGKILGPVGFIWSLTSQSLPMNFGWILLTNDLLWWPMFALYLRDSAHFHGGWKILLRGGPITPN